MKIAIIGAGSVGTALGKQLQQKNEVKYGVRFPDTEKANELLAANPGTTVAATTDAAAWADVVVLATPGPNDDEGIKSLAASTFDGVGVEDKIIIDATNPLTPYQEGLQVRWKYETSGAEVLQAALPGARVFKAWNTIGVEQMSHPDGSLINGQRLTMLFVGDDKDSVDTVGKVIDDSGFAAVYAGPLRYARNLEAIAELWIHIGAFGVDKTGDNEGLGRNFHFQVVRK